MQCVVSLAGRPAAHLPVAFVVTFDDGITEEFSLDLASGCSASAVCRGAFSWTSRDGVGRAADADAADGATETKAPKSALLEAARPPAPQDSSSRAAIICKRGAIRHVERKRQLFVSVTRARGIWKKCHCLHDCLPDEPLFATVSRGGDQMTLAVVT